MRTEARAGRETNVNICLFALRTDAAIANIRGYTEKNCFSRRPAYKSSLLLLLCPVNHKVALGSVLLPGLFLPLLALVEGQRPGILSLKLFCGKIKT